ncbi:hypothetical protein [Amycolatopsis minnesotensis]|uniref:Subtilisin inhibitor-like n=1 Tax=Amycolatopsis minnesotensis TaxID=337894 RepID=A0ABP5DR65_9PSEU
MRTTPIVTATAAVLAAAALTGCVPAGGHGPVPGSGAGHRAPASSPPPALETPDSADAVCDGDGTILRYSPHTPAGRRYAEKMCANVPDDERRLNDGLRERGVTSFGG